MKRLLVLLFCAAAASAQVAPDFTPPAAARQLEGGLAIQQLFVGTGNTHPSADDLVKLRYTIWRSDGKMLERIPGDRAAVMQVSRIMTGWRTVVEGMVVGERTRAWIPSQLGDGKIPDDMSLVIDTELVDIIKGPQTPPDLDSPPADAERTKSGLVTRVLRPGTGMRKPGRRSKVVVNYSGWTTDGRLFDSTSLRGVPAEFRLDEVIAGWTEGLQLMVEGEMRRFWIPAKLAYASAPDKPQGKLVFDIELIAIK